MSVAGRVSSSEGDQSQDVPEAFRVISTLRVWCRSAAKSAVSGRTVEALVKVTNRKHPAMNRDLRVRCGLLMFKIG
jgi:hypothetical protein